MRRTSIPLIIITLSWLLPQVALASFITLVTQTTTTVNESESQVHLSFTVRNDGDEQANELYLSFPTVNRSQLLAKEIAPKAEATSAISFSFSELGITRQGNYTIPLHITYRDINSYPLSSPQLVFISRGTSPSRVFVGEYKGVSGPSLLSLSGPTEIALQLTNTTAFPAKITQFTFLAPTELQAKLSGASIPVEVAASTEHTLSIALRNSGALINSEYATWTIVQGEIGDRHFAENFMLRVHIDPLVYSTSFYMKALILSLGILTVLIWGILWWRQRCRENKVPSSITLPQ